MQKTLITALLMAFISIGAIAQNTKPNLEHRIYPGTVTTTDGETIKGYIRNTGNENNQNKCTFYTDMDDERTKKVYKPSELKGFSIENFQYKSMDYSGNIGLGKATRSFLFIAKPGVISMYLYFIGGEEQPVWQKGDEEPVSNASMLFGFKKAMQKLVGDDTDLAGKIDRKEKGYGKLDIMTIVDEYNTWAASKK
ncbi:hypothetical protein [Mucilaginibacter sp.]|jgi:hypothetical protein|uniref:hypothetical protein n=1 Tax=Mucilaginibacter sp. TaxID=1882438 RepID=UPI002CFBB64D|nr:hypothetical protein [Mucilaginibacter sp.]HTI59732.1 hypothetical protein [Mucilaginibacter sp.]